MKNSVFEIGKAFSQLFFPRHCLGCGSDLLISDYPICADCIQHLPITEFEKHGENPVEKIFWGRARIKAAAAHYYFYKDSRLQHIIHHFKYKGRLEVGIHFGSIIGKALVESGRFQNIQAIVPLPLFKSRQKKRGYNQAEILCRGISLKIGAPVLNHALIRQTSTQTQTTKDRINRWQNMEGRFQITTKKELEHKHVLLVDDIITTGATLDACANALLDVEGISISIAALAFTIL
jgi:ComF family protein